MVEVLLWGVLWWKSNGEGGGLWWRVSDFMVDRFMVSIVSSNTSYRLSISYVSFYRFVFFFLLNCVVFSKQRQIMYICVHVVNKCC